MFETFTLSEADRKDIKKVLKEFQTRCAPMTNVIYERYLFNKRVQEAGESLDHYITVVMKQADLCTYGNLRDELIRDRLVSGIRDDRTREKLLNRKDINLARTIELLKSSEATQCQALDMAIIGHKTSSVVQVVRTNPQHKKATQGNRPLDKGHKPCKYCGKRHEFSREACPAADKVCYKCNKRGHFARLCRAPKINHTEEIGSDDEEVFFVNVVKDPSNQPALVTCIVNERHKVVFEIDTGASCNILPFSDYIRATEDRQGIHISSTKATLTMHNNSKAVPMGKVMLYVERGGSHYLCFFIMKSCVTPILGKSTCVGMKLIKIIDCDVIHSVKEAAVTSTTEQLKKDPVMSKLVIFLKDSENFMANTKYNLRVMQFPL